MLRNNYWYDGYRNGRKTFFLCVFLGWLGAHRFYQNRTITGFLYLITFGFCGIGVIVDLFLITYGKFKVSQFSLPDRGDMGNKWYYNWASDEVPTGFKVACWIILSIVIIALIGLSTE